MRTVKTIKWNVLIITCAIILLPILFGLSVWNQLPDQIAIHFDINNQPDNYATKAFAVFGLPLMMLAFQVFTCLMTDFGVQRYSGNPQMERLSKWIIPVITLVLYVVTIGYGLGWAIDMRRVAVGIVGILFVVLGSYPPRLTYVKHYNFAPEVAKKINRFTGFGMVILGILGLLPILLPATVSAVWLGLVILYGVISVVYTLIMAGKYKNE